MRHTPPIKAVPQRELRNHCAETLRQAESGQQFAITVEGRPVAVLGPHQKRPWVPKAEVLKILRSQTSDPAFFEDLGTMGGTLEDLKVHGRVEPGAPRHPGPARAPEAV
ncbi:MAG TPA: type II toxin-antitoxin system prevent-host-death family antitoxin [Thermoanaerobaculia bacterium]